jgi:transposase
MLLKVRYTRAMKTTRARLDWREVRRRRAWELKQQGWSQTAIAAALGVTSGAVSQWLKRARVDGVEEGLRAHPASGRPPKLTPEQRAQLPALLDGGAEAYGFRGQVWTCKRVVEVIRRTFGVTYDPSHVARLLHQLGYSVQRPIERATQRDEAAIRGWWEQRWPVLKKRRSTRTGALSG